MLDPQRIGLNAASVGFLKRTGQNVDWASFNLALQTDDSRCADVRAEMETPVDELHVMGGQRFGLEGNSNLKTNARQERQINGYPLRSFSADAPAIILPDKYGGLPMYTRNQTEYSDFVSRYTAPLSTALQNDTVLLGRQGYSVTNESASHPYRDVGFEHNMHKSKDAIDYNEAAIKQRQWLQYQSQVARKQKYGDKITTMRMSSQNGRGVKNAVDGIFISANGEPMTQVNSDSLGAMAYGATTEHTRPPREDTVLAGPGNQPDPSRNNLEYNNAAPSNFIGNQIIGDRPIVGGAAGQAARRAQAILDHERYTAALAAHNPFNSITRMIRLNERPTLENSVSNSNVKVAIENIVPMETPVRRTALAINEDPLRDQSDVLSSAAYIPGGSQALSLLDSMRRRLDRIQLISGREAYSSPDLIERATASGGIVDYAPSPLAIIPTPEGRPRRNRRREAMSAGANSNRQNEVAGFAVREARIRRAAQDFVQSQRGVRGGITDSQFRRVRRAERVMSGPTVPARLENVRRQLYRR